MPSRRLRRLLFLFPVAALVVAGLAVWWWSRSDLPEARLSRGREAIRRHDFDAAERESERLDAAGHADLARLLRGETFLAEGRPDRALRELNRIEATGRVRIEAASVSGRCLLALGQFMEARRVFQFVVEEDPDNADGYRGLASVEYDLGNLSIAQTLLETVAKLDPTDGRAHRLTGLIYTFVDQDADAEEAYLEALKRHLPGEVRSQVLLELAGCRLKLKSYEPALEALDQRPERRKDEGAEALAIRAESLYGLGRRKDAAEVVARAEAAGRRGWRFLLLRGQLFLDEETPEKAIAVLRQATEDAPGEDRPSFVLSKAYRAALRNEEAAAQEKVTERIQRLRKRLHTLSIEAMNKPRDAAVRAELADLFLELGNKEMAALWRRAAEECKAEK